MSESTDWGLRIAMVGTRGVPASYGGFETAVEEIGWRLAARGHDVVVYCRRREKGAPKSYRGMTLVHLPSLRVKVLETLSHTGLSTLHILFHRKPNMAFVFNAANSPFLPILKLSRVRSAVHVDGLEWKRGKWGSVGRRYYRRAEELCVRWADALIADARGIADYYRDEFEVETELLTYGAPIIETSELDRLADLGLQKGKFHLVVARFEPENNVDLILQGFISSSAQYPLVVVGSAPYAAAYSARIAGLARDDDRVRLLGGIWDQAQLDALYSHTRNYIHGHSVGGTNPSLLRAMGAGAAVVAWDVNFNRDVLGSGASFFSNAATLGHLIVEAERSDEYLVMGAALKKRAQAQYDWDLVTSGYEALARKLSTSNFQRPAGRRRRLAS